MQDGPIKIIGPYRYYLNRCLGQGSFGKVYEGFQDTTRQKVAVKKIDFIDFKQSNYLENAIYSEISILNKIRSPYIVEFKEVLTSKRSLYIITQFCQDGDLKDYLSEKGRLSQTEAEKIMSDLLRGFLALLKHKVIHRDMKPANVLRHGKLFKLCDFGFAKDVQNFTEQMLRTIVGSPLYMAPQLLQKTKYTTKCDIWSLGIIWYQMVAGKTPWSGKSDVLLLENIKKFMPPFGSLFSSKTSGMIRKMLCYDQQKRIGWEQLFDYFELNSQTPKAVVSSPILSSSSQQKPKSNTIQQNVQIRHFLISELYPLSTSVLKEDEKQLLQEAIYLISLSTMAKTNSSLPEHEFVVSTHNKIEKFCTERIKLIEKRKDQLNELLNYVLKELLKFRHSRITELIVWACQVSKGSVLLQCLNSMNMPERAEQIIKRKELISFY